MRNRIRQRMLRRIALAFAVAAVAAPTAQAVPLEPGATQSVQDYGRQHIVLPREHNVIPIVDSAPYGTTIPQQYGMPTAMPTDNRDRIENVRLHARNSDDLRGSDRVENVRVEPRGLDNRRFDGVENVRVEPRGLDKPVLVVSDGGSSFDWSDAGIGAGLAFAAILLGGAAALGVRQSQRLGQV